MRLIFIKEIQDIFANYTDSLNQKSEKASDVKTALRRFNQKLINQKFKSAPLAISILNVMYGFSYQTRNNLDIQIIQEINNITLLIFNLFKNTILTDELSHKDDEIIGETDDFERILYLAFETSFNITHDGVKYRKSKEIFSIGVTLMARILGAITKCEVKNEKFTQYELRYDQLENSITTSGMDTSGNLKECLKLVKKRYTSNSGFIQNQIEKELNDLKFNVY
jgi:hypothetical protein